MFFFVLQQNENVWQFQAFVETILINKTFLIIAIVCRPGKNFILDYDLHQRAKTYTAFDRNNLIEYNSTEVIALFPPALFVVPLARTSKTMNARKSWHGKRT